jgi:hypothetical protein
MFVGDYLIARAYPPPFKSSNLENTILLLIAEFNHEFPTFGQEFGQKEAFQAG